jgi:hypothetical protein
MIEFVTFFVGVLFGVHPVQLEVSMQVAEVEIRLNHKTIETLDSSPWVFHRDFGPAAVPHRLDAIARNAKGIEIDRATQWINLGHQSTEARFDFDRDGDGNLTTARLSWTHIGERDP